ncbi:MULTISPECIES: alpha/beta hydrolase [unclassified Aureimonas]|uniref:alpha/beta hydrolase n=1 Tax=unclassified Aureimonas TaxID=2615206 RepID=UPI0006FD6F91|nr:MULTISPECIES: alpha/beta fold hydrolase [unclassified Aureimonas]KQT69651.1 hypothetical protein ASG62_00505 [Aureimonas sp. Leaf427]KQT76195.1 hypothetical protein ASG54_15710 [Aureimonas sp. Leaf460]
MTTFAACGCRLALTASLLFALALSLAGCGTRPGSIALVPVEASVPGAKLVTVYVATDRERLGPSDGKPDAGFGSGRARDLAYAEFTISIPPGHESGRVEWFERQPGPDKSFATVRRRPLTEAEFRNGLATRVAKASPASVEGKPGEVAVFVHGYNYSLQEGLFRLAQLTSDSGGGTVPVLFSWPSEAAVTGYVADRDAVTFSRDHLVKLLSTVHEVPGVRKTTLIGHSMGGWLVVESLRQLRLLKHDPVLAGLDVVLAAPDIDVDVFRTQMETLGSMKRPLMILVSQDDRALAVSSRVAGGRPRIGAIDVQDPRSLEIARRFDLRIVDISTLSASDRLNHDRFVAFASVYASTADVAGEPNGLRQAGAYVFNAAGAAIASPFTLVGGALAGR